MIKKMAFRVRDDARDERVDRFVADAAPDLSRARIKSLIDQGLVQVDGLTTKASRRLKPGQNVTVTVPEPVELDLRPDSTVPFEILYQDDDIVVLNKPAGVVVHPAAGHYDGTLVHGLLAACGDLAGVGGKIRPGIVHRLDKDTSGVMVAAKNDRAHQVLTESFKNRTMSKTYLAVCLGTPPAHEGEINLPIGRHPVQRKLMSTRSNAGKPALTRYKIVKSFRNGVSLLRLELMTGRTHQIRVHLASAGCPILGDAAYGSGGRNTEKRLGVLKGMLSRQMLHAFRLGFRHPVTGEALKFEAPLPVDMVMVLRTLAENDDPESGGQARHK